MNHTDYVSYDQAKLLYELDFDWNTLQAYYNNARSQSHNLVLLSTALQEEENCDGTDVYLAPSLAMAQRWLREVKRVCVEVKVDNAPDPNLSDMEDIYFPRIITISGCKIQKGCWNENLYPDHTWFWTYEEALSAGIEQTLKLLNDNR